jgi:hypothetical protein
LQGDWDRWIELASRWMATGEFERVAYEMVRAQIELSLAKIEKCTISVPRSVSNGVFDLASRMGFI